MIENIKRLGVESQPNAVGDLELLEYAEIPSALKWTAKYIAPARCVTGLIEIAARSVAWGYAVRSWRERRGDAERGGIQ
jgi:hypothetical protein